ncbi:MAG TPA: hypothetical protein DCQ31_01435 [Bacteroidales bacterium]|nr:hypothetical protein [Bacteroidales bacterium]
MNAEIPWGNATVSTRWNHLFTDKLFLNTTLVYSTYDFSFGAKLDNFELKLLSGITDWNAKTNLTWIPNTEHTVKTGFDYIRHKFRPGTFSAKIGAVNISPNDVAEQFAHEFAAYISDEWKPSERFSVQAGLRATAFMQVGPFKRYLKNEFDINTDTIVYGEGDNIVTYKHLEPRLAARFILNEKSSIKASFTQNYQYIHLASISSGSMPTDLWVPSSELVKPQFGVQYAAGYFYNFADNTYETSVELYYKQYENQIEYKDGVTPGDNIGDNTDNAFVFGSGESYGAEFFIKKGSGRFTGWIGYTWSKTERTFPDINFGKTFPAKYDSRHDLSIVLNYDFTKRLNASVVFVYSTGNALTLPIGRYLVEGSIISEYGARNGYRMPAYHRADLSATYLLKKGKFFESNLNFSVYNVYNRKNPYFIFFETEGTIQDGDLKTTAKQISLFPILPSISWNFKF